MTKEELTLLIVDAELAKLSDDEQAVINNAVEAIEKSLRYYPKDIGVTALGYVAIKVAAAGTEGMF